MRLYSVRYGPLDGSVDEDTPYTWRYRDLGGKWVYQAKSNFQLHLLNDPNLAQAFELMRYYIRRQPWNIPDWNTVPKDYYQQGYYLPDVIRKEVRVMTDASGDVTHATATAYYDALLGDAHMIMTLAALDQFGELDCSMWFRQKWCGWRPMSKPFTTRTDYSLRYEAMLFDYDVEPGVRRTKKSMLQREDRDDEDWEEWIEEQAVNVRRYGMRRQSALATRVVRPADDMRRNTLVGPDWEWLRDAAYVDPEFTYKTWQRRADPYLAEPAKVPGYCDDWYGDGMRDEESYVSDDDTDGHEQKLLIHKELSSDGREWHE